MCPMPPSLRAETLHSSASPGKGVVRGSEVTTRRADAWRWIVIETILTTPLPQRFLPPQAVLERRFLFACQAVPWFGRVPMSTSRELPSQHGFTD